MLYNFKEYKPIFDTPMKRQQEIAISRKIMDLLNKNKYDNLEEFITKNDNYQDFLKENNMQTVIKHFGNTLKEEDYINILENLRTLSKTKQEFETNNIKTTNIGNNQYNSFKEENKTYFIDNSNSNMTIEEQMKFLQAEGQSYQTNDIKKNAENLFKDLGKTKKESFNLAYLNQINYDLLNNNEKELFNMAKNYEQNSNNPIQVDLKKGIMVDAQDNIMKINKINKDLFIAEENNIQNENKEEQNKAYTKQMTLKPSRNTIYTN